MALTPRNWPRGSACSVTGGHRVAEESSPIDAVFFSATRCLSIGPSAGPFLWRRSGTSRWHRRRTPPFLAGLRVAPPRRRGLRSGAGPARWSWRASRATSWSWSTEPLSSVAIRGRRPRCTAGSRRRARIACGIGEGLLARHFPGPPGTQAVQNPDDPARPPGPRTPERTGNPRATVDPSPRLCSSSTAGPEPRSVGGRRFGMVRRASRAL